MLKEQLLKDIDLEAKAEAAKMKARVPIFRYGYEAGWYDAGEKYAEKWQAAEERAESTTEKIIDLMDFVAEAKGHISDEEIISQIRKSLPGLLEALTPKQASDE